MKTRLFKTLAGVALSILISGMPSVISGQATSRGEMPQYLFAEFSKCEVLMKGGQLNTPVMNYNIVSERMVFITNDKYYDMTNPEAADTIYLNECKFIPVGNAFYEVLVSGKIDLFIQHKGNLMSAGKPVGYGGTSQTASANYISNLELSGLQTNLALPKDYLVNPAPVYRLRIGEKWSDFTNERQFITLFPDKSTQIKNFIRENKIKIDRPENLSRLVRYCSEL